MMHFFERKEFYCMGGRRDCTHSGIDLVGVAFVERFDTLNKKWEDGKASWKDGSCICCCKMVGIIYKTNSFTFFSIIICSDANR